MPHEGYRDELGKAVRRRLDPTGCALRHGVDRRNCPQCWPGQPTRWCDTCLLLAVLKELEHLPVTADL
jgi:hypothetical protein